MVQRARWLEGIAGSPAALQVLTRRSVPILADRCPSCRSLVSRLQGFVLICELPPGGHSLLELSSRTWRSAPAIEHDPPWSNRRAPRRPRADAGANGSPRGRAAVGEPGRAPGRVMPRPTRSRWPATAVPGSAAVAESRSEERRVGKE